MNAHCRRNREMEEEELRKIVDRRESRSWLSKKEVEKMRRSAWLWDSMPEDRREAELRLRMEERSPLAGPLAAVSAHLKKRQEERADE